MKLLVTMFASILLIGGCTAVPSPIDVDEKEILTPFEVLATNKDDASYIGSKARWGGKIVKVENKQDVSEIEVVFFPENSFGKPRTGQASAGRFKAVVEGFVDPIVFEKNRLITVVGEVSEVQSGLIGDQTYQYPTLNALGYHMWKETTEVDVDAYMFSPFGFHAGYHRGFFSPWYDPFWGTKRRVKLRVTEYNGHKQGARVDRDNSAASKEGATRQAVSEPRNDGQQKGRKNTRSLDIQ